MEPVRLELEPGVIRRPLCSVKLAPGRGSSRRVLLLFPRCS